MPSDARYRVPMLANALDILELVAGRGPLGLAPLCAATGISKTSAFRILATLAQHGYVERAADGRYHLGPALARLGRCVEAQSPLLSRAAPVLAELHARFGETVNLVRRDGDRILYVAVRESGQRFRISAAVGDPVLPHVTACGKAILAWQPPEVVRRILRGARRVRQVTPGAGPGAAGRVQRAGDGLPRYTPRSLTTWAQLARALAKVREEGLAYDDEEAEQGVSCIGVPLIDERGIAEHALSVSGPTSRVRPRRTSIAQALLRAGRELSAVREVAA